MYGIVQKHLSIRFASIAGVAIFLMTGSGAWAEADGPDAWRVVGVAPNDALNARIGPGTQFRPVGQFAHDARGLRQITCVPLLPPQVYFELSEAERDALPPRWCLMESADYSLEGWVAQRFLAEDHSMAESAAPDAPPEAASDGRSDALTQSAERLVRRLYDEHLRAVGGAFTSPLHPARVGDFFTDPLAEAIAGGLGADPLFNAQDVDITDLRITLDTERPMFRGLITVNADFRNFGRPQRAVVHLRAEGGSPRIIRIAHEDWTIE